MSIVHSSSFECVFFNDGRSILFFSAVKNTKNCIRSANGKLLQQLPYSLLHFSAKEYKYKKVRSRAETCGLGFIGLWAGY